MTYTLPADMEQFLEGEVAAGRYASVSDAVRDALERLRHEREAEDLRGKLQDGIRDLDAGLASNARTAEDIAAIRTRILQKAGGQ